ncbi:hypothetical protein [Sphingomonas sp. NFX23]|uniref:hypothetical protein n=1 Tax=Sphingomonas sp. NFX23 TaxID=2819532 RepID=UPI003CF8E77E
MIALYAASVGWMVAASSMPQQMDRHRIDRNKKDEDGQAVRRSGGQAVPERRNRDQAQSDCWIRLNKMPSLHQIFQLTRKLGADAIPGLLLGI